MLYIKIFYCIIYDIIFKGLLFSILMPTVWLYYEYVPYDEYWVFYDVYLEYISLVSIGLCIFLLLMSEDPLASKSWQYIECPSREAYEVICAMCGCITVKYYYTLTGAIEGFSLKQNALLYKPSDGTQYYSDPNILCPQCFDYHFHDPVLGEKRYVLGIKYWKVTATRNSACGYGKNPRKIPENQIK